MIYNSFVVLIWIVMISMVIAFALGIILIIFSQKDIDLSRPKLAEMIYKSMFTACATSIISLLIIMALCVITVFMAV